MMPMTSWAKTVLGRKWTKGSGSRGTFSYTITKSSCQCYCWFLYAFGCTAHTALPMTCQDASGDLHCLQDQRKLYKDMWSPLCCTGDLGDEMTCTVGDPEGIKTPEIWMLIDQRLPAQLTEHNPGCTTPNTKVASAEPALERLHHSTPTCSASTLLKTQELVQRALYPWNNLLSN